MASGGHNEGDGTALPEALAQRLGIARWRYDADSRALSWSTEALTVLGHPPDAPSAAWPSLERGIEPGSRALLVEQLTRCVEAGTAVDAELLFDAPGGEHRWLRLVGDPVRRDGRVVAVEGWAQDRTELHRERAQVESLSDRLQAMTRGGWIGLFEVEPSTRGLRLDEEAHRLHGLEPDPGVASLDDVPVLKADCSGLSAAFEDLDESKPVQAHYRVETADGSLRWLELTGQAIGVGGPTPPGVEGVVRDVTEARAAEARLQETEVRLGLIERSLDAVFWIADLELTSLQYVSPSVERLFGVPAKVLMQPQGLKMFRSRVPDEDRARARSALAEAAASGARTWRFEQRVARSDGRVHWLSHSGALTESPEGPRLVGVTTDVTHQRRTEEELLRASKLEAVGRLAGGIAHDFNNLLSVITGYANVGLLDAQSESEQESFQFIADAARQAAGLTRRLLLLGRPQPADIQPVALGNIVTGLEGFLRRVFGPRIRWKVDVEAGLPEVAADPAQLEQVLLNLAVNARDAMSGAGTLEVGARRALHDGGLGVAFWVEDDGEGIPPELHDRIFEPFFTTKADGEGTGLGLPTVRTVLERLGGRIELDSEVGRGTRFEMWIPATVPGVTPPPPSRSSQPRTEPIRVAVVDDDDMVRETLQRSLRRSGFTPCTFADAPTFLSALNASEIEVDAVVSDVRMPRMSGLELVAELRRLHPTLPVLLVSGYVDADDESLPQGVALLAKPFTHQDLITRVQAMVD